MSKVEFPKDFVWGAATSSYQIEGASDEDGRDPSIWDTFSRIPDKINDGSNGNTACEHYHRWREDIESMKQLGLHAYRFSIAWPRILPDGKGWVNEPGIDFYSRIVDGLLEADIQPFVTLYHWDLPQILQDGGGWPVRSTAEAFVEYADVMTRALGDRVKFWATLNEPFVSAHAGYLEGRHAPGHQSLDEMLSASHHLLLAHGLSIEVIRANARDAQTGIVLNINAQYAASTSAADRAAAWQQDGILNRWYLDPINGRGYPCDMVASFDRPMDFVKAGDLDQIATPIDFLGVNYYSRGIQRSSRIPETENLPRELYPDPEHTEMGWEVHAPGLYGTLARIWFDYRYPSSIYIS